MLNRAISTPIAIIIILILVILVGGFTWLQYGEMWRETTELPEVELPDKGDFEEPEETTLEPKNCNYLIEGKNITLEDGYSELEIVPGSASKIITQYFGNEGFGDFNGDGLSDTAFILTQNQGGSGTFYYMVVALGDSKGCEGTNAVFLGDRVAPQTTKVEGSKIFANYAQRKLSEPIVTPPSIAISKQLMVKGSELVDVTPEWAKKEQSCLISGGSIGTSLCCKSTGDFPNSCLIGACGCSPDSSHQVKICDCGEGKCFDGEKCAILE